MTEDCKKSEKNIDNLLFSGDDEIDNFANDLKIKNISLLYTLYYYTIY